MTREPDGRRARRLPRRQMQRNDGGTPGELTPDQLPVEAGVAHRCFYCSFYCAALYGGVRAGTNGVG